MWDEWIFLLTRYSMRIVLERRDLHFLTKIPYKDFRCNLSLSVKPPSDRVYLSSVIYTALWATPPLYPPIQSSAAPFFFIPLSYVPPQEHVFGTLTVDSTLTLTASAHDFWGSFRDGFAPAVTGRVSLSGLSTLHVLDDGALLRLFWCVCEVLRDPSCSFA